MPKKTRPWALPVKDLLDELNSAENGLSQHEARKRLNERGFNDIGEQNRRAWLEIFVSQFMNALILILIGAAVIAYLLGEVIDSAVIIGIVLLNSIIGFIQEYKAEKALRKLRKYIVLKAKVLREGKLSEIDSRELVAGDIVLLDIGDVVPADILLMEADELSTNESSLTGESLPVQKSIGEVSADIIQPREIANMAFMGTVVASGMGKGVVAATGRETFFGKTATSWEAREPEGEFQRSIRNFGNFLLKITLAMTFLVFGVNALLGKEVFDSFLFAVALAVGITPEMLPIIITIALSNGALKMAEEKVVIKKLASVEDLGNIDTLCCDKTGTLTEGKLSLLGYVDPEGRTDESLVLYGLLCNSAKKGVHRRTFGNPVDKAIWESHAASIHEHAINEYQIADYSEFDFERKRMSVLAKKGNENILIAKGAFESIFSVSDTVKLNGGCLKISPEKAAEIKARVNGYENEGYKVLAIAEKQMAAGKSSKEQESGLCLTGFLLFLDPPKKSAKASLKQLENLKVAVKVISGDSTLVTKKICSEVGLPIVEGRVITGDDLDRLNEAELEEACMKYNVFAEVTPEQKEKIVASLNKEGHIVGFLGDGVNDVSAIRAADVGISVDSAAGVAKEAADIILLKKSLNVLADGIVAGRRTFGNITKYILNTISANFGNMSTVALSSAFLPFIPLLPSQILLNNFASDIPLLTVSTDNVDSELLKKPKRWNIRSIGRFMAYFGFISMVFDLALIFCLTFIIGAAAPLFRTAWFVESALSEIIITFAIRTRLPFFKSAPSKWLILASALTIIGVIGITYTAIGAELFDFVQMPFSVLVLIALVLAAYFLVAETAKGYFFSRFEI